MTNAYITIHPLDGDPPPTARLGGTDEDIPMLEFPFAFPGACVSVGLGNHDDPAGWLRDLADRLCELAEAVDTLGVSA